MPENITETLPEGMEATAFKRKDSIESLRGSLYTFTYLSKTASIGQPLILNVRRKGVRQFYKNGNQYMAGIVLNDLSSTMIAFLLKRFGKKRIISWRDVIALGAVAPKAKYRIYNLKYRTDFHTVDASIYMKRELEESL